MSRLQTAAPAKLNLALAVTGRRADGYHTLRSVFARLALHDDLAVEVMATAAGPDRLVVAGAHEGVSETDNLVLRAARELRIISGAPLPALHFRLTKRIPVAAGLAGGSSDAAAALELAARSWAVPLDPDQRRAAAVHLGADVSFFAAGHGMALVGGIGEDVEPLPDLASRAGILLVTTAHRLATADVFAAHDRERSNGEASAAAAAASAAVAALSAALRAGMDAAALVAMAPQLRDANDLWAAAASLSPALSQTRDALEQSLGRPVLLTGSGPTLFAVYPSEAAARATADGLRRSRQSGLAGAAIIATSTASGGRS